MNDTEKKRQTQIPVPDQRNAQWHASERHPCLICGKLARQNGNLNATRGHVLCSPECKRERKTQLQAQGRYVRRMVRLAAEASKKMVQTSKLKRPARP